MAQERAIELCALEKRLGGREVLCGASLAVAQGEIVYVTGRSGAGKSVLARIALGLLAPDKGEVWLLGRRLDALGPRALRKARAGAALVLQGAALLGWLSLEENVALPLRQGQGLGRREALLRARETLAHLGLSPQARALPATVSAGTRQRAAVARALALRPRAVVFDEPTTGLDPKAARQIDRLVRLAATEGAAVLVVSHDMESVRRTADRTLTLSDGVLRPR